jgi:phosphoribosylformylglycinamidine cyclo-ligase
VSALAHITGGGLLENIPRVLPDGMGVELFATAWKLPSVFAWLARTGELGAAELARTFNCGLGMVAVVPADRADEARRILTEHGETVYTVGRVRSIAANEPRVVIVGMETAWPV